MTAGIASELYRSDRLCIRSIAPPGPPPARWVIAFDHYGLGPGFDRDGFGEAYFRAAGIPAILVLGQGDDWYQYPDMLAAARIVRRATAAARRITYGSSMGGHAALHLAEAMGADAVLALSPQWTIDPARAPWEQRWGQEARRIRWRRELAGPIRCRGAVIAFDPHLAEDRRHAEAIAAETPAMLLPIPRGGHPVTTYLAETGLLAPLLAAVLDGTPDRAALAAGIRAARRASPTYLGALAEAQPAHRPQTALAIARRAAETSGGTLGLLALAQVLRRTGETRAALALHRRLVRQHARDPLQLVPYAEALADAGQAGRARAIAREVTRRAAGVAHLHAWRADLNWRLGRRGEARRLIARAVRLDPGCAEFRRRRARYRWHRALAPIAALRRWARRAP